jgi:hypothetical protein
VLTVLTHDDAILLVAERRGAKPPGAIAQLKVPGSLKRRERALDVARFDERALGKPVVKSDAELGKIAPDEREHFGERKIFDLAKPGFAKECARAHNHGINIAISLTVGRVGRQIDSERAACALQPLANARQEIRGDRHDVGAAIATSRKCKFLTAKLQVSQPDA